MLLMLRRTTICQLYGKMISTTSRQMKMQFCEWKSSSETNINPRSREKIKQNKLNLMKAMLKVLKFAWRRFVDCCENDNFYEFNSIVTDLGRFTEKTRGGACRVVQRQGWELPSSDISNRVWRAMRNDAPLSGGIGNWQEVQLFGEVN